MVEVNVVASVPVPLRIRGCLRRVLLGQCRGLAEDRVERGTGGREGGVDLAESGLGDRQGGGEGEEVGEDERSGRWRAGEGEVRGDEDDFEGWGGGGGYLAHRIR